MATKNPKGLLDQSRGRRLRVLRQQASGLRTLAESFLPAHGCILRNIDTLSTSIENEIAYRNTLSRPKRRSTLKDINA